MVVVVEVVVEVVVLVVVVVVVVKLVKDRLETSRVKNAPKLIPLATDPETSV